jgi:hypothetical protein
LVVSGNTLQYKPTAGYTGPDTFSYRAVGVNNDGSGNLNSGDVTVQVTVDAVSATPVPPTGILMFLGIASLGMWEAWRRMKRPVTQ